MSLPNRNHSFKTERAKYYEYRFAIEEDIKKLLELFQITNSFSFKDFSRFWCLSKFSLIYLGKHRTYEVPTFTQLLFKCTKKYLVFSESKYIKVGALFILYGLYYKQPFKNLCKIRILKDEFRLLTDLIHEMRIHRHLDPVYVFSMLLKDNAFDYVYTQFVVGPSRVYSKEDLNLINDISIGGNIDKEMKIVANECLNMTQEINDEYQTLLTDYLEKNKTKRFKRYNYSLKKETEAVLYPPEATIETQSNSLQREIKKKAYNQIGKTTLYKSVLDENDKETDNKIQI